MVRSVSLACVFLLLLSCYLLPFCFARDIISTSDGFLSEGETIISAEKIFELGFLTRGKGSDNRYVGIWYYRSDPKIIVWVANRDNPLTDEAKGAFGIAEEGNLLISGEGVKPIWKTKLQGWDPFKGMIKLLDSGNLVLIKEDEESNSARVIWESFKNPTDTFLPGMFMDEKLKLVSWASPDDPGQGKFTFQKEDKQYIIRKEKSTYYWKSGVSGDFISDDILPTVSSLLSNTNGSAFNLTTLIQNSTRTASSNYSKTNMTIMRLVMNSDGNVQYFTRRGSAPWNSTWWEPQDPCNVFNVCGNSASCDSKNKSMCECLPGFEAISPGVFSEGCRRSLPICGKKVEKIQSFTSLKVIKVRKADVIFEANSSKECQEECLKSCDCQAYSFMPVNSQLRDVTIDKPCWIWSDDLDNIQYDDTDGGPQIHLRTLVNKEDNQTKQDERLDESNKQFKQWPLAFAVTAAIVIALAFTVFYIYTRKATVNKKEERGSNLPLHFYDGQRHVKELIDSGRLNDEDKKAIDLPFFDFESILAATDSFSEANKLGKGGFGPVYKGNFPGGQEIAVKRLSRVSGQGMEEFKNEVVLIARLQHRNLVRLLGYCIEGEEKILLYEFMLNKSLDSFIFDPNLGELLDWDMRFDIILGIARGLLYLHQDSRLRIIHRDLKTSNILLDGEMNPKISDFGLARIFEGKQTKGATNRVVGTYGYMSPEYALDGFFSVKSDVFSFGVVILEIISGKKNTGFYNSQEALSLLSHVSSHSLYSLTIWPILAYYQFQFQTFQAWRLWQEDKALDMMDQQLRAGFKTKTDEVLKCINVGFLCVQEDPDDRPTMSDVVILLSSATATLPIPKRPAFVDIVVKRGLNSMASSSSSKTETTNEMTVTLQGR
ncbi:hypothetical protein Ddye_018367 [Dipteronia dyeriana]|uniref:Receptor-like serine/threonine-protein kinase n=1 Tax=Dipteronia dyeriana TaxID=168575 RepID=A0AAD9UAZ3_9ROSI|nr:hypothetical protein Ddye_018367 [Dipteronia dyeriana]